MGLKVRSETCRREEVRAEKKPAQTFGSEGIRTQHLSHARQALYPLTTASPVTYDEVTTCILSSGLAVTIFQRGLQSNE